MDGYHDFMYMLEGRINDLYSMNIDIQRGMEESVASRSEERRVGKEC